MYENVKQGGVPNITWHSHNNVDYHGKKNMMSSLSVEHKVLLNIAMVMNQDTNMDNTVVWLLAMLSKGECLILLDICVML